MPTRIIACAAAAFASAALAQTSTQPQTNATMPTPPAAALAAPIAAAPSATLRAGTPVMLKASEALTTEGKHLRVGQRFQLETAEDVLVDGQIAIPAGSPAIGEVTDVRYKGMWGKSGRINGRVLSLRANGRQIRLTGSFDDKGVTGTAGVVGAIVFVPVAGFFVTGTSAQIPIGAPVKAFIDEDVPVAFAAATPPAPMMIAPVTPPRPAETASAQPQ